jgi:hypothetical protein
MIVWNDGGVAAPNVNAGRHGGVSAAGAAGAAMVCRPCKL